MDESRKNNLRRLLCLLPSVLAILFTGLYALGLFPYLHLVFVNILCIPLALLEMALGFIDGMNKRKAAWFTSSMVVCALASLVNIQKDDSGYVTLLELSIWAKAWLIAFGISTVAFLVILIRLFRWTQQTWECNKSISQVFRLKKGQEWKRQQLEKQTHHTDLSKQKYKYQLELAKQRYDHKKRSPDG